MALKDGFFLSRWEYIYPVRQISAICLTAEAKLNTFFGNSRHSAQLLGTLPQSMGLGVSKNGVLASFYIGLVFLLESDSISQRHNNSSNAGKHTRYLDSKCVVKMVTFA